VKLFARLADEDAYVRESIDEHQDAMAAHMRVHHAFMIWLTVLNAALLVGTAAIGIWLGRTAASARGVVATALPLAWQLSNVAGWGELGSERDLRERRRGAGRHAVDRRAAHRRRPARRASAGGVARRDRCSSASRLAMAGRTPRRCWQVWTWW
jgi:hypothetical protein